MIEITNGFTSIDAGADSILDQGSAFPPGGACAPRRPTGARVIVEFCRTSSLSATQAVTVRYDFAADGNVRAITGIPKPIRTVVRQGQAVLYYYRLSHWIAASELMDFSGNAPPHMGAHQADAEPRHRGEIGGAPMLKLAGGATATDPFPA